MKKILKKNLIIVFATGVFTLTSCVPGLFDAESGSSPTLKRPQQSEVDSNKPPEPITIDNKPTIYSIDQQTFRFKLENNLVWNAALDVLMRNYNLTIVDEKSGVITTEWDSFYLSGDVFRNKISMRIINLGRNNVNVSLVNNVEYLKSGEENMAGSIWLPGEDQVGEINRIIQNMAIVLGQPKPDLPSIKTAKTNP